MQRSRRFKVHWTLYMCVGGMAAALFIFAMTRSPGWAIAGVLGSGVILKAIGQAIVRQSEASSDKQL